MTEQRRDVPPAGTAVQEGLSWTWHLDLETLLAALSEPAPWNRPPPGTARPAAPAAGRDAGPAGASPAEAAEAAAAPADPVPADTVPADTVPADTVPADTVPADTVPADPVESDFADYLDALDAGLTSPVPLWLAAGRIAEILPPSPDLAAWLACHPAGDLEDIALPGAAAAFRRLAAWAQAGELAVVAQMASRSAAADEENGTGEDGRPCRVTASACGQVSLALTMSQSGAQWWTGLAVDLQWRLAATGTALREGTIDLPRAKAIAEATAPLDDGKARAVEAKILPKAGDQTTGQLKASLRRAVITADPEGAERRREEAERRAKVTLYPDAEGTASLAGQSLPGIHAAAAMARLTALARALKATGAGGGIDLLRSKVFLGLLLGTLPHIPPPPGGPADTDCPPRTGPGGTGPGGTGPGTGPGGTGPGTDPADDGSNPLLDDWPWNSEPAAGQDSPAAGKDDGKDGAEPAEAGSRDSADGLKEQGPVPGDDPCDDHCPGDDFSPGDDPSPGQAFASGERWSQDDDCPLAGPAAAGAATHPVPWPEATCFLPPGPAALKNLRPAGRGFLDLRLPWATLMRGGPEPGCLTRLGAITPAQASSLARLAASDPDIEWRVVLAGETGRALAVTRVRRPRSRTDPARAGPGSDSTLLQRVTVIMPVRELSTTAQNNAPGSSAHHDDRFAKVLAAITDAARKAADRAAARAAADAATAGCAHSQATPAYQVPARLREHVTVRDLTCRFPTCRQPAWRCDADHTQPFDQDGPTCSCNLGSLCRHHHKLKQHPRWQLNQPAPGTFTWTTPAGRTYTIHPDQQAA